MKQRKRQTMLKSSKQGFLSQSSNNENENEIEEEYKNSFDSNNKIDIVEMDFLSSDRRKKDEDYEKISSENISKKKSSLVTKFNKLKSKNIRHDENINNQFDKENEEPIYIPEEKIIVDVPPTTVSRKNKKTQSLAMELKGINALTQLKSNAFGISGKDNEDNKNLINPKLVLKSNNLKTGKQGSTVSNNPIEPAKSIKENNNIKEKDSPFYDINGNMTFYESDILNTAKTVKSKKEKILNKNELANNTKVKGLDKPKILHMFTMDDNEKKENNNYIKISAKKNANNNTNNAVNTNNKPQVFQSKESNSSINENLISPTKINVNQISINTKKIKRSAGFPNTPLIKASKLNLASVTKAVNKLSNDNKSGPSTKNIITQIADYKRESIEPNHPSVNNLINRHLSNIPEDTTDNHYLDYTNTFAQKKSNNSELTLKPVARDTYEFNNIKEIEKEKSLNDYKEIVKRFKDVFLRISKYNSKQKVYLAGFHKITNLLGIVGITKFIATIDVELIMKKISPEVNSLKTNQFIKLIQALAYILYKKSANPNEGVNMGTVDKEELVFDVHLNKIQVLKRLYTNYFYDYISKNQDNYNENVVIESLVKKYCDKYKHKNEVSINCLINNLKQECNSKTNGFEQEASKTEYSKFRKNNNLKESKLKWDTNIGGFYNSLMNAKIKSINGIQDLNLINSVDKSHNISPIMDKFNKLDNKNNFGLNINDVYSFYVQCKSLNLDKSSKKHTKTTSNLNNINIDFKESNNFDSINEIEKEIDLSEKNEVKKENTSEYIFDHNVEGFFKYIEESLFKLYYLYLKKNNNEIKDNKFLFRLTDNHSKFADLEKNIELILENILVLLRDFNVLNFLIKKESVVQIYDNIIDKYLTYLQEELRSQRDNIVDKTKQKTLKTKSGENNTNWVTSNFGPFSKKRKSGSKKSHESKSIKNRRRSKKSKQVKRNKSFKDDNSNQSSLFSTISDDSNIKKNKQATKKIKKFNNYVLLDSWTFTQFKIFLTVLSEFIYYKKKTFSNGSEIKPLDKLILLLSVMENSPGKIKYQEKLNTTFNEEFSILYPNKRKDSTNGVIMTDIDELNNAYYSNYVVKEEYIKSITKDTKESKETPERLISDGENLNTFGNLDKPKKFASFQNNKFDFGSNKDRSLNNNNFVSNKIMTKVNHKKIQNNVIKSNVNKDNKSHGTNLSTHSKGKLNNTKSLLHNKILNEGSFINWNFNLIRLFYRNKQILEIINQELLLIRKIFLIFVSTTEKNKLSEKLSFSGFISFINSLPMLLSRSNRLKSKSPKKNRSRSRSIKSRSRSHSRKNSKNDENDDYNMFSNTYNKSYKNSSLLEKTKSSFKKTKSFRTGNLGVISKRSVKSKISAGESSFLQSHNSVISNNESNNNINNTQISHSTKLIYQLKQNNYYSLYILFIKLAKIGELHVENKTLSKCIISIKYFNRK